MWACAKTVLVYVVACVLACSLAPLEFLAFGDEGELPLDFAMMIVAWMTACVVLGFVPFVAIAHLLIRKVRPHRLLPLISIPLFGTVFLPMTEFLVRYHWLPDVDAPQVVFHPMSILYTLTLAQMAIAVGLAVVYARNRVGGKRPEQEELRSVSLGETKDGK